MRAYTYIVESDSGFAPNPFHGWCTLATCKPAIRRTASPGDWVVGLEPKRHGNGLVYVMQIEESLSFGEYWNDERFRAKRPTWTDHPSIERCGDNCHEPLPDGEFRQIPSGHYNHRRGREGRAQKQKDLSGKRVLIAQRFAYFGIDAPRLPEEFSFAIPGRGHRVNFATAKRDALVTFLEQLPSGLHGMPRRLAESGVEAAGVNESCGPCGTVTRPKSGRGDC